MPGNGHFIGPFEEIIQVSNLHSTAWLQ
jgi:hypothetical protein